MSYARYGGIYYGGLIISVELHTEMVIPKPFTIEIANCDEEIEVVPELKINNRVHDKKSKLEALKDFGREHFENPMSNDKRLRLKAKRKKRK